MVALEVAATHAATDPRLVHVLVAMVVDLFVQQCVEAAHDHPFLARLVLLVVSSLVPRSVAKAYPSYPRCLHRSSQVFSHREHGTPGVTPRRLQSAALLALGGPAPGTTCGGPCAGTGTVGGSTSISTTPFTPERQAALLR